MGARIEETIGSIVDGILEDLEKGRAIDRQDVFLQPDSRIIVDILQKLLRIVFPGYYVDRTYRIYNVRTSIATATEDVAYNLVRQVSLALRFDPKLQGGTEEEFSQRAQDITSDFLMAIPRIREYLNTDIEALYDGDPAATNIDEIIITYPGLYAIFVHRFAHELYSHGVPVLPRIMSEHAHSLTGIDINPGATIGKYFFIDHGTGIVVGETTVIGDHVKLYQGVTLGALSTRDGHLLSSVKRHPTIEDNVTIYSGASILGGNTVIGKNSVIGGNVFLTRSVPEDTKVHVQNQELTFDRKSREVRKVEEGDDSWYYVI